MVNASGWMGLLIAAMLAFGAMALAAFGSAHPLAQVGLVVGLATLTFLVMGGLTRGGGHPRPRVAGAFGGLTAVPVVAFATWRQLDAPLGAEGSLDGLDACFALLAAGAVAAVAWRLSLQGTPSRGLLPLALVLTTSVVAEGVATSLTRPSPAAYLASFEPLDAWRNADGDHFDERRAHEAAIAVGGSCVGAGCLAHVRVEGQITPLKERLPRGVELSVARAPATDALLLRADGVALALVAAGETTVPTGASLARHVSPPVGYVGLALLGWCGVLGLGVQRRRLRQRRRRLEAARQALVGEGGWMEDAAGIPQRTEAFPGPTLVLREGPVGRPYRGQGTTAVELEPGDRASALAAIARKLQATEALALSWGTVLSAPMLVSMARGWFP